MVKLQGLGKELQIDVGLRLATTISRAARSLLSGKSLPHYRWSRTTPSLIVKIPAVWLIILGTWLAAACTSNPSDPITTPISMTITAAATHTALPTAARTKTITTTTASTPTLTTTSTPMRTTTPTSVPSFHEINECVPENIPYQAGLVIEVIDGDTIVVEMDEGITNTVRYIGIDSPESGYPFFEDAKDANADLVLDKRVMLVKDQSEMDGYNRLLRYVFVGQVFVNQELVRRGFASAASYPPDEACKDTFTNAELEARQEMAGMWVATPSPEPSADQVIILAVNKREEWVDIQNVGDHDVDLAGWNLVSERGHQDCPLQGTLPAGETLRVWAMEAQGNGFSCGYSSPIWNNTEADPAVLYNAEGVEVSRK